MALFRFREPKVVMASQKQIAFLVVLQERKGMNGTPSVFDRDNDLTAREVSAMITYLKEECD